MKITRISQFEAADETARELWNLLLQRIKSHDEAVVVLNRLLGMVENHAEGLKPTVRRDFRSAQSDKKPKVRCESSYAQISIRDYS